MEVKPTNIYNNKTKPTLKKVEHAQPLQTTVCLKTNIQGKAAKAKSLPDAQNDY